MNLTSDESSALGVPTLASELSAVLNRYCAENDSDTPDFILAAYLLECLESFSRAVRQREAWYGRITTSGAEQKET
jgi:hypothetical protein